MSPAEPAPPPKTSRNSAGIADRAAIALRAAIVAAGTLLSRVLGLARDIAIATLFTQAATDAFFVAFAIPNALRQLLAEGAVTSAVMPVLAEVREKEGDEAARSFYRALHGLFFVLLLAVSAAGMLFAPALCELFAAGFHAQPGQFERTVTLTRSVFAFICFAGSSALAMGALNSHRRFAVSAFSPALINIAMIGAALVAPPWLSDRGLDPALALSFGALLGGALQVISQWPSLRSIGYLRTPRWQPLHPKVREVMRRMLPMLLGMSIYFINVASARRLLSGLGEGAQSYFTWAMRLCALPQGIFILALSTATLPSLASLAAAGEREEASKTYAHSMRLALFIALPCTALLTALAHPIVVAVFQRGEFHAFAAAETASALFGQALGLGCVAAMRQLLPVYFACGDTRTPAISSGLNLAVFIGASLWLRDPLGHAGVSLAYSLANLVQTAFLWGLLGRELPTLRGFEIGRSVARTALACVGAVVVSRWTLSLMTGSVASQGWGRIAPAAIGMMAFTVAFAGLAWLVRCEELRLVTDALKRRVRRGGG